MSNVSPPKVTLRTSKPSSASSPWRADVFDFVTTSVTRDPEGIDTPFVALTTEFVVVVMRSPTASEFEHTLSPLVTSMLVPALTVPLTTAGRAGSRAGVLEAVLPLVDLLGLDAVGRGRAGVGLDSGGGTRPATIGTSAVVAAGGTTSTLATESRMAELIAESAVTAEATADVSAVFPFSPPHALSSSSVMAESGTNRRVVSSVDRICGLRVQMVARRRLCMRR